MTSRQPNLIPSNNPSSPRLTEDDRRILEAIHTFEGVINLEQVGRLFPAASDPGRLESQMRRLVDGGYLKLHSENAAKDASGAAETIYWLDEKGAAAVAAAQGSDPAELQWQNSLNWPLLSHNLKINRFHIDIIQACESSPTVTLQRWVTAREFWAYPESMPYTIRSQKIGGPGSRPDGFFQLRRALPDRTDEFAFVLEIDAGTGNSSPLDSGESLPGMAYLRSKSYQQRFGIRYGRWLVVAADQKRVEQLRDRARRADGKGLFYFTTREQVSPDTVLTDPIWWVDNADDPTCLIPPHDEP